MDPSKLGSLASTPCQMMLGDDPGSPNEHPCGATPTVGVCGLRRYCAQHLEIVARTCVVLRDADADLKIDENGDLVATPANFDALRPPVTLSVTGTKSGIFAAPQPDQERKVIRCENVWTATPAARIVEAPPDIAAGDYIRIDWTVPDYQNGDWSRHGLSWSEKPVWVEGEVMRVHRPGLDLVADVRVDRSNWMRVGSVEGIGIGQGAKRIPRPGAVEPTATTAGLTAGDSYVVGQTVSTPTGKFQCTASGTAPGATLLPPGAVTQHIAILLRTQHVGGVCCQDSERCPRCGGVNHSQPIYSKRNPLEVIDTDDACERCMPERWREPDALPIGKAPQCGHQALTDGCATCAILREHLARIGVERAARILMAEAGALAMVTVGGPRPTLPDDTTFNSWPPVGSAQPNPERETWPSDASVAELRERMAPPPRPDGFSQAAVDAAKAVLLAPVAPKGGKR